MFFVEELLILLTTAMTLLPSVLLGIGGYVLSAVAVYVIARRRGLQKPWLAWVPVVNVWLLGSLSDQYSFLMRRKNTSCRKWLLALNLVKPVLAVLTLIFGMETMLHVSYGFHMGDIWELWLGLIGFGVPLAAVSVWAAVLRYMSLYDVYKSMEPENAVLFTVLSILFSITEPFFLFFNRDKDGGMPPRREPEI